MEDNSSNGESVQEFLRESNAIEREYSEEAFEDAQVAWDYAMQEEKLSLDTVKQIHFLLMQRIYPEIAGKFRRGDVWIAGERKKFTDEGLLDWEVDSVLNTMWLSLGAKTKIPFRLAAKCHVLFEQVHPFVDGNGRTGRILYNVHRIKLGLPVHVIHVGREQGEYYDWFRKGV